MSIQYGRRHSKSRIASGFRAQLRHRPGAGTHRVPTYPATDAGAGAHGSSFGRFGLHGRSGVARFKVDRRNHLVPRCAVECLAVPRSTRASWSAVDSLR
jgi:hypothetical protein